MKNMKFWRTALVATLVLTVMLSVSGGTIAWFTDSVESKGNVIEAGTLKIDLLLKEGNGWVSLKENTDKAVLSYDKWEPGYTAVKSLKIANKGTLALEYVLNVIPNNEVKGENGESLADVIDVYMAFGEKTPTNFADIENGADWWYSGTLASLIASDKGFTQGIMLPASEAEKFEDSKWLDKDNGWLEVGKMVGATACTIALHMQEEAGNEYQGLSLGEAFVKLDAKQYTYEPDSFDPDYDEDALYPGEIGTADDLKAALAEGKSVKLTSDVALTNDAVEVAAGSAAVIDLNGKTLSVENTEAKASAAINNKGTLTLKNGTVTYKGVGDPNFGYGTNTINNTGKLVIDGATIINTTTSGSSVAIDNAAGAELIINSGVIKSEKNAIRLCPFGSAAINATINGGTITGARAIQIQLPSNKPAEAPVINLTVNGGILTGTDDLAIYSYSAGQSLGNVKVVLAGGTYNGNVCFGGGSAKTTQENVSITGGTFNGELGRYLANDGWENIAKPQ